MKLLRAGIVLVLGCLLLNGCSLGGDIETLREKVIAAARWESLNSLANKFIWLQANAQNGDNYTLEVRADESIKPQTLSYKGKSNITITLTGIDVNRTISLSSNGAMFTVDSGVTLVLDNNITLRGHSSNTGSLVRVDSSGTLIMNNGSTVTGNTSYDGGVFIQNGTFTMNGGEISGNIGDGVFIQNGTFTMSGGEISGNTRYGVYMPGGTFTMNGGEISGNIGRGVRVSGGTFTMEGGEISGNTSSSSGGGVFVWNGTFTKTGGTITGYASDRVNGNVVKDDSGTVLDNQGHAVYAGRSSYGGRKETTAGPGVNLSCVYNNGRYTYSGDWDYY